MVLTLGALQIPYLVTKDFGMVTLGFGQSIQTNEWTTIAWGQVVDSTVYTDEFINRIVALEEEFNIAKTGFIRLSHVLTANKESAKLGFFFKLESDKGAGQEDILDSTIYLGALTLLPNACTGTQ